MTVYPLGRRHAPDPRDAQYPMRAVLPTAVLPAYRYWAGSRVHLNQTGDTCVANAWTHLVCDSPHSHRLADVDADNPGWRIPGSVSWGAGYVDAQSGETGFRGYLYGQAQQIDEFSDTPPQGGTSVRAGAKVLQELGVIASYHWAAGIADLVDAVLLYGPVIVGTSWYESMFTPVGADAILTISGAVAGGHAWKIDGYNQQTQLFRMKNSWGSGWGLNGYAHISADDVARLVFDEQGEGCIAVEA